MAYTIPSSADTTEQAILAVASAVKGEQVTGGDGSVNKALDILADALAGENVTVPMTQQGAILALAQYVGGGGGVDVGALAPVSISLEGVPTVGGSSMMSDVIERVSIGDTTLYDGSAYESRADGYFAAGLTLATAAFPASSDTMSAYVCTLGEDFNYATVVPWDGTLTREDATFEGGAGYRWTFTMPELQEGEMLVLYAHTAS